MSEGRKPTTEHNYLRKIADLQKVGAFPPQSVGSALVTHDEWCDALSRRGFCNCDPDIALADNSPNPTQ